jgi:hypothetical protein
MKLQACFQLKAKYIAKICCKTAKYIFAKWNIFFSASLYSRTRTTSKTVHHIMEDNFALRYVLKHPGVNSRAELEPRRRLGDNKYTYREVSPGLDIPRVAGSFPSEARWVRKTSSHPRCVQFRTHRTCKYDWFLSHTGTEPYTYSIRPFAVALHEKCLENDFRSACLGIEIFLRELTLSKTLSSNPKSSRSLDLAFSHKLLFYFH